MKILKIAFLGSTEDWTLDIDAKSNHSYGRIFINFISVASYIITEIIAICVTSHLSY